MEKSALTEVKAILKSLVLSCPEKITVEKLNRDYRDVEGQFIPFRQLGYGNLEQFLRSLPDTLRVFGSGPTAMVCFVANEKSDHIHDMIMRQKKPKSKSRPRSGSKSGACNRSNAVHCSSFQKPVNISGQQLSPYQNVNRNQTTKTLEIKPLPQVVLQRPNYVSIPFGNEVYGLSQPNGITLNPVISTIKNGILKSVNAQSQFYQNKVDHINNLLKNQCYVSNPSPHLPRLQNRDASLPVEKKSSGQIVTKEIERPNNSNILSAADAKKPVTQIVPPTAKQQIFKNLSEELENMPKLNKVSNNISVTSENLTTQIPKEAKNITNVKSPARPKTVFDDSTDYVDDDSDEAVPLFAAKNNVFRLDFPEYTVPYGYKIAPYKLPDDITVGSCITVFISEIHNPFRFWFHIHKENHELDLLMYQIEHFYSRLESEDLRIPILCLTPGQVCAACYNGFWHRAEIVAPPVNKSVKLSFMDYGTVTEVEIENVKFLVSSFAKLPAQALRGCLSHIKPRQYHWSHEATYHFLSLVEELMLYAKITEIDTEKNILYMILCDTNSEEAVQVNSSLVENRFAYYNEDWKTERIKQNNGKRLRHPREDFPTFSMIESGEYPNFQELVNLQQRGIDYEAIHDRVVFNQSSILNKRECASERLKNLPFFLTTSNPFCTDILLELYATTSKAI